MSADTANREATFDHAQRGEGTSRLESRLDGEQEIQSRFESSAHEGLHAEDCPQLMKSIEAAQKMGEADAEAAADVRKEYLAASADGGVRRLQGDPDIKAIMPEAEDNEFDRLKKSRLAQLKLRAAERQAWRDKGHGVYAALEDEAAFLKALPEHERAVCHLVAEGSLDGEMLHHHMRALCEVHLETFFCRLGCDVAPVMMAMVSLEQLPALLLCRGGRVVGQLTDVDRSFTTEGVAFELAQQGMIDFEDGTKYARPAGGCTTATANTGGAISDHSDDDISD